ncbi:mid1-interacting protein 1-like protein [Sarcoptes scabiei]|uniref:Mid1-interacting protein 1-like protein n=1 Tax=Sarcoptes scabiei TaxID=52283 RepID=A0A132AEV5_SARSC|nr:mid1-interacting protein 1-like protein [Sarcoptes scabiei]
MIPGTGDLSSRRNHTKKYASVSHQGLMCSQQSILTAMERFVRSMNNMDATVLVPSKLQDMNTIGVKVQRHVPIALTNTELHNFYLMLNDVKKELLWGPCSLISQASSHDFVV